MTKETAGEGKESDLASAKELVGVVVSPADLGSIASLCYLSGKASRGQLLHHLAAVTARGRVIVLTVELNAKRPRDMAGSSWSWFPLAPRLKNSPQPSLLAKVGVVKTADEELVAVLSRGRLYLLEVDATAPVTRQDLVLKTFVESTVFRIPGSDASTGDLLNLKVSLKRDSPSRLRRGKVEGPSTPGRQQPSKLSKLSLFELAALKPKEKRLNSKILRSFLDKHGKNVTTAIHPLLTDTSVRPVPRKVPRIYLAFLAATPRERDSF